MTNLINRIYDFAAGAITEQVGTSSNRQDVYGGAVDAQSASIDDATITEDIQLSPFPFQLYVDVNGDDSNSGLSASEPLATIGEAFNRLPAIAAAQNGAGNFDTVTGAVEIVLTAGQTHQQGRLIGAWPWLPALMLRSSSPGTHATIEATGAELLQMERSSLVLEDIEIVPADTANAYQVAINSLANCRLWIKKSSRIVSGTSSAIGRAASGNNYVVLASTAEIDCDPVTGSNYGIVLYGASMGVISGTITDADVTNLYVDRGSACQVDGATISGGDTGIISQDGSVTKVRGGATISCDTAYQPDANGYIVDGDSDTSGSTNLLPGSFSGFYSPSDAQKDYRYGADRYISGGAGGEGVILRTPDGTDTYRVRVDNSGNVVTDGPL